MRFVFEDSCEALETGPTNNPNYNNWDQQQNRSSEYPVVTEQEITTSPHTHGHHTFGSTKEYLVWWSAFFAVDQRSLSVIHCKLDEHHRLRSVLNTCLVIRYLERDIALTSGPLMVSYAGYAGSHEYGERDMAQYCSVVSDRITLIPQTGRQMRKFREFIHVPGLSIQMTHTVSVAFWRCYHFLRECSSWDELQWLPTGN